MEPWPLLSQRVVFENPFLQLRAERRKKPGPNKIEHEFFVFDMHTWINVIALTKDRRVVLVRQFRAATREISLEIPGGAVDRGESPRHAAERELREETGYTSSRIEEIGVVEPNPALLTNRCYTYLAWDAEKTTDPQPDPTEQIEVHTETLAKVRELIAEGKIRHALVVAAVHFALERLNSAAS